MLKKEGKMPFTKEVLDEILKEYKNPADMFGSEGLLKQLTKALVERVMEAELTHQLGYEKHSLAGHNSGNSRNGKYAKTITGSKGELEIAVPRDRKGEYQPKIIPKGERRFEGFDEKIISMYGRGMTVREIQGHLLDIYGVEVSPELISTVTNEVIDEVKSWQARPLDPIYPIIYLDALVVKVKDGGRVINKSIYLAIGVNMRGLKEHNATSHHCSTSISTSSCFISPPTTSNSPNPINSVINSSLSIPLTSVLFCFFFS